MNPSTSPATRRRRGADGSARQERSQRTAAMFEAAARSLERPRRVILDEIVLLNGVVARSMAGRYRGRGVAEDDLQQIAYEGLVKAVRRFDPAQGDDFLSYAVPTIRGELQRYFRDRGWSVRPPRRLQELQWRINHSLEGLTQQLGREPTRAELVDALGVTDVEYGEAVAAFGCFSPRSLDRPLSEDSDQTLGDLVVSPNIEDRTAWIGLTPLMRRLPERDRRILYLRYFEDLTQAQIGSELGVTQMQVSRLLERILTRLRGDLAGPGATGR